MGSSSTTIGFRYYLGVHAAVCIGPVDAVTKLEFDNRTAWEGEVTANGRIGVFAPELFGGDKREGGVVGSVDLLMGEPGQGKNAYLMSQLGTDIPTYRGIFTVVFRGFEGDEGFDFGNRYESAELLASLLSKFDIEDTNDLMEDLKKDYAGHSFYWASLNPYIKAFAPTVKRILKGWTNGVWNAADAAIGDEMNPAHIIYQCLTDPAFGLGISASRIGASFDTAADQLLAEEFGLSLMWTRQESVEDFIGIILTHIDATLYEDRFTGLMELKLVRDDYDVNTLDVFGPDEIISMESFSRPGWGETVNEVIVQYTNRETSEDAATVSIQDLANIRIQGGVVNSTRDYPGINSESLARRVAARDLRTGASPLASLQFTINRTAWNLAPGFVFKLNWPDYNVSNLVCRVLSVDYGDLDSQAVTVNAVEDVFALPDVAYGEEQTPLWEDPTGVPLDIVYAQAYEATWPEVVRSLGATAAEALPPSQCFVTGVAQKPGSGVNVALEIGASLTPNVGDFSIRPDDAGYTPVATIAAPADYLDTTAAWSSTTGWPFEGTVNAYAYWDDEIVLIESVDTGTQTITMKRGCHDTVPQTHSAGSKVWVFNGNRGYLGVDSSFAEFAETGDSVYLRFLGRSLTYTSALASAPQSQVILSDRWLRPYPPADVKIDAQYYPSEFEGAFEITWVSRNRLTQDGVGAGMVGWTEAAVLPEDGTTYTLEVYDDATDSLRLRETGLTVDGSGVGSFVFDSAGGNALIAGEMPASSFSTIFLNRAFSAGSNLVLATDSWRSAWQTQYYTGSYNSGQTNVGTLLGFQADDSSPSHASSVNSLSLRDTQNFPSSAQKPVTTDSDGAPLPTFTMHDLLVFNSYVYVVGGWYSSTTPYNAEGSFGVWRIPVSWFTVGSGAQWAFRPGKANSISGHDGFLWITRPTGVEKVSPGDFLNTVETLLPGVGMSWSEVEDEGVFVATYNTSSNASAIRLYDLAGVELWETDIQGSVVDMRVYGGFVWVPTEDEIVILDRGTGAIARTLQTPQGYAPDGSSVSGRIDFDADNNIVWVGYSAGGAHVYDAATGEFVASVQNPEVFYFGAVFSNEWYRAAVVGSNLTYITTNSFGQQIYGNPRSYVAPFVDALTPSSVTRVELYAERDGLQSHQKFVHTMTGAGYGFDYGNNYGGQ